MKLGSHRVPELFGTYGVFSEGHVVSNASILTPMRAKWDHYAEYGILAAMGHTVSACGRPLPQSGRDAPTRTQRTTLPGATSNWGGGVEKGVRASEDSPKFGLSHSAEAISAKCWSAGPFSLQSSTVNSDNQAVTTRA